MALSNKLSSASNRLHFRILAPLVPIVLLMVVLSGIVLTIGLRTVSHFVDEPILFDLQRGAREIYNLCDSEMQALLLHGSATLEVNEKVTRAMTLGKIDDYATQNEVRAIVYSAGELLLGERLATELNLDFAQIEKGRLLELSQAGKTYYAYQSSFELW